MVSIMDEALELEVGHKVLEVGAGSGWHASTIAEIVAPSDVSKEKWGHVYTVERIPELAAFANENITNAGYGDRITVIHEDGTLGYPKEAPYNHILVTAAAPAVPKPLVEQLENGGILIVPVGGAQFYQTLVRIRKKDGKTLEENLGGVAFVPLIGKHGFKPYLALAEPRFKSCFAFCFFYSLSHFLEGFTYPILRKVPFATKKVYHTIYVRFFPI
jgi:protein-L-isoaspartate(D-aspartate) O-methyltransferase